MMAPGKKEREDVKYYDRDKGAYPSPIHLYFIIQKKGFPPRLQKIGLDQLGRTARGNAIILVEWSGRAGEKIPEAALVINKGEVSSKSYFLPRANATPEEIPLALFEKIESSPAMAGFLIRATVENKERTSYVRDLATALLLLAPTTGHSLTIELFSPEQIERSHQKKIELCRQRNAVKSPVIDILDRMPPTLKPAVQIEIKKVKDVKGKCLFTQVDIS